MARFLKLLEAIEVVVRDGTELPRFDPTSVSITCPAPHAAPAMVPAIRLDSASSPGQLAWSRRQCAAVRHRRCDSKGRASSEQIAVGAGWPTSWPNKFAVQLAATAVPMDKRLAVLRERHVSPQAALPS
jgi:hypothetical protein